MSALLAASTTGNKPHDHHHWHTPGQQNSVFITKSRWLLATTLLPVVVRRRVAPWVASRPPSKAPAALCPETPSHLTRPRAERIFRIAGRQRLKGECLAALLRADGDAVRACAHTRRLDPCSGHPRLLRHLLWIPLDVGILRGGHGGPLSTGVPNRRNARNGTVGTCPKCAT